MSTLKEFQFSEIKEASKYVDDFLPQFPVLNHTSFKWGFHQGYVNHEFGIKAGPVYSIINILHEIGHAIEFGSDSFEERTTDDGRFIFNVRRIEMSGEYYEEPRTSQITARESRVGGIQLRLAEVLQPVNHKDFIQELIEVFDFLPDWSSKGEYETRKDFISSVIMDSYHAYPLDRCYDELTKWFDKIERL